MHDTVGGIVRELVELSYAQPLRGESLERAKSLMRKLRRLGYTNSDIEKLTKGRWSEATVKLYTRGEKVQSGNEKASAMDTMAELISSGASVEDVRSFLDLNSKLSSMGLSIDGLANLLREAQDSNLPLAEISRMFDDFKAGNLSIPRLVQINTDMSELKAKGITADDLAHLAGIGRKLGGLKAINEAFESYGGLQSLNKELQDKKEELEKQSRERRFETRIEQIRHDPSYNPVHTLLMRNLEEQQKAIWQEFVTGTAYSLSD